MIPAITAVVRALMRVSPWKMWLYSCAITPCSSSRESRSMQPRVTPITERDGSGPAANALTEWSSSRYTGGTGTPDAIDISSTIFRSSRSLGSRVAGSIGRPPSISAIFAPPCESCASLTSVAMPTTAPTTVTTPKSNFQLPNALAQSGWPPRCFAPANANGTTATNHSEIMVPITPKMKSSTSRPVCLRALSWLVKKSVDIISPQIFD